MRILVTIREFQEGWRWRRNAKDEWSRPCANRWLCERDAKNVIAAEIVWFVDKEEKPERGDEPCLLS